MIKHICGQCQKVFNTEEAYLRHACPIQNPVPAPIKPGLSEKALLSAVREARRAHHSHA